MSDEAVIRIVLQGDGNTPANSPTPSTQESTAKQPEQDDYFVRQMGNQFGVFKSVKPQKAEVEPPKPEVWNPPEMEPIDSSAPKGILKPEKKDEPDLTNEKNRADMFGSTFAAAASGAKGAGAEGIQFFKTKEDADALVAKLRAEDEAKAAAKTQPPAASPPPLEQPPTSPSPTPFIPEWARPNPKQASQTSVSSSVDTVVEPPPQPKPEPQSKPALPTSLRPSARDTQVKTPKQTYLSSQIEPPAQPPEPPKPPNTQPPEPPEEPEDKDENQLRKEQQESNRRLRHEVRRLDTLNREEEKKQKEEKAESLRRLKQEVRRRDEEERRKQEELEKDPEYVANKLVEKARFKDEVNAIRAELEPAEVIPVHDPEANAEKRRQREREKALDEEAYEKKYGGDEEESDTDKLLKVADSMRGSIGGILGPIAGSILDIVSKTRKIETEGRKKRKREDLLAEAREGDIQDVEEVPEPDDGIPWAPVAPPEGPPPPSGTGTTGGGGMAGMASAVAVAVPIVAAAMAVDQAVKGAVKGVIGGIGGAVANIAGPSSDPSDQIARMGEAASQASDYLGPFSYSVLIAGESVKALSSVMKALDQTAQRYGEYSPQIAQSQAVAEIRQTMGDFRRAQVVSSEMAKYVAAQSDVQQKFEDMKVKILVKILPLVTQAVEMIGAIMSAGDGATEAIGALAAPLTSLSKIAGEALQLFGKKIDEDNLPEDPTTQILNSKEFFDTPANKGWVPDR